MSWMNKVGGWFGDNADFGDLKDKLGDDLNAAFQQLPTEFMQTAGFSDLPDKDLMRLVESVSTKYTLEQADQIKAVLDTWQPTDQGILAAKPLTLMNDAFNGFASFAANADAEPVFDLFGRVADPQGIISVAKELKSAFDFDFVNDAGGGDGAKLRAALISFPTDVAAHIATLKGSVPDDLIALPPIIDDLIGKNPSSKLLDDVITPLLNALPDKLFGAAAVVVQGDQLSDAVTKVGAAATAVTAALPATAKKASLAAGAGAYDGDFDYAEQGRLGIAALSISIAQAALDFLKAVLSQVTQIFALSVETEAGGNGGTNVGALGGAAAVVNAALQKQIQITSIAGVSVQIVSVAKAATAGVELLLDLLSMLLSVVASVVDSHRTAPADVYNLLNTSLKPQS
jgi:hypothetical protein